MPDNILDISNRTVFRNWLINNCDTAKECYLTLKRGKPVNADTFYYLDAVEEALCFGWIDCTLSLINGVRMQRFTPRTKNSNWTELNKERVRRLEKLGLMTEAGRKVLPDMNFEADLEIVNDIKNAGVWNQFMQFPVLYQRVRLYNLSFVKSKLSEEYSKSFQNFVEKTKNGAMYGEWNDYGRLIDY